MPKHSNRGPPRRPRLIHLCRPLQPHWLCLQELRCAAAGNTHARRMVARVQCVGEGEHSPCWQPLGREAPAGREGGATPPRVRVTGRPCCLVGPSHGSGFHAHGTPPASKGRRTRSLFAQLYPSPPPLRLLTPFSPTTAVDVLRLLTASPPPSTPPARFVPPRHHDRQGAVGDRRGGTGGGQGRRHGRGHAARSHQCGHRGACSPS